MNASVKAVLFDVDGTLVDTGYLHTVAWWEAFAQAGYVVPMADPIWDVQACQRAWVACTGIPGGGTSEAALLGAG